MKKFFLIFVTLFLIGTVSTVYPQCTDNWVVTNYNTGEYLQAVAGDPLASSYVAVGSNGYVLWSLPGFDGFYWTTRGRLADNLQDVVWAGDIGEQGLFVAVGSSGTILTSLFGGAWYEEYSGVGDYLYAVNSGNGIIIAGGDNGRILTSTDGVNWTASSNGTARINDFAFNTGRVAYCNSASQVFTSDNNGISWTWRKSFAKTSTKCITYGNGIWLMGGRNKTTGKPVIWRSTNNAVSWTQVTYPYTQGGYVMDMAYTGSEFVSVGINFIYASTNGLSWVHRYTPPTNL
jgi:hypothetical protein